MFSLDDDETDLVLYSLQLLREACGDFPPCAIQTYVGRKAAALISRIEQYQKDMAEEKADG